MVRVTIKSASYDRIEFEFADCEVAGKFLNVALASAVGNVKAEIEKVAEPEEGRPEEPEGVLAEEMESVEEFF